jgi:hypothetical protein
LDQSSKAYAADIPFEIIGAYYGISSEYSDVIQKIRHYEYYKWDHIQANHENFFSNTSTDDPEYLTLIYTNNKGIFTISCEEDESLYYNSDRTSFYVKNRESCILPGIMKLNWEQNADCTWAGAIYAAFRYLGENITYEQIMGLSGACYRIAFTEIWDWSAVDALVSYDYSSLLFRALGYEQIWVDRLEKSDRKSERKNIIADIEAGKPVIAINLRIAPEWGVITGFTEKGKILLCRTYFDAPVFDQHKDDKDFLQETGGYLETDGWPYLIVHFGERFEKPSAYDSMIASLRALIDSFSAPVNRGYCQGEEAYKAWIDGLKDETGWAECQSEDNLFRRMSVNDYMLLNLKDARRCAAEYLRSNASLLNGACQELLLEISSVYNSISQILYDFRNKEKSISDKEIFYNAISSKGVYSHSLRSEQINLLKEILSLEEQNKKRAEKILLLIK